MSHAKAMEFLRNSRISKDNFTNGAEAIDEDGEIVDNAEVMFDMVRIANRELENVKMIIIKDQEAALVIGDAGLKQFGEFTIDEENDVLIFKEEDTSKDDAQEEEK
jgi:hypothetical protein